jgi:hypothetical protein
MHEHFVSVTNCIDSPYCDVFVVYVRTLLLVQATPGETEENYENPQSGLSVSRPVTSQMQVRNITV